MLFGATLAEASNPLGVTVGAIRWDAWIGKSGNGGSFSPVGPYVEKNLIYQDRPAHYPFYDRWPFYAKMTSADTLEVRQLTPTIMDQDIAYAKRSGINYWAFNYYPSGSGMDIARNLYFTNTSKAGLNFTYIIDKKWMPQEMFSKLINGEPVDIWTVPQGGLKDQSYQRVLNGRPLLYIFSGSGINYSRDDIATLRSMAASSGVPNPYIVLMTNGDSSQANQLATEIGADAISGYASSANTYSASGTTWANGSPYANLAAADQRNWASHANTGKSVVPWVTTGWDNRPRSNYAVPWCEVTAQNDCKANPMDFSAKAQPHEIAANLQAAINWTGNNQQVAAANTVIMYAWNEFDEGGWLTPTHAEGTARIDEISNVLR